MTPDSDRFVTTFRNFINSSYLGKWSIVGILIGIVAGLGATAFYYLIQLANNNILGRITGYYPPNPSGELAAHLGTFSHFFLVPISLTFGGLISGLLVFWLAPEAEGHGTDAAIDSFHNKNGIIRKRVPIVKMLASAITIGSGGSGGREGPTALISAGFGSYLGTLFGLSVKDRRIAVAAGIGAGIGSIFRSPFGGAILSAEILYSGGDMEVEAMIPAFIASPTGYVIFASFTSFSPIFGSSVSYSFIHPFNLLFYTILGIVAGIVGKFYTYIFYKTKDLFSKMKVKNYLKPMIGGAIAGTIALAFPQVIGMGYGFVQFLIDGQINQLRPVYFALPILAFLILLVFAKIFATSFTVSSGGSAGVFGPSLVIGGFLGAAMWEVVNMINPAIIPSPAPFVIVGMMAMFAGVGRAPIAVILMVSEMTGTLSLMIPSMVAVVLSYYIVGPKSSIYRSQVRNRAESPVHKGEYNVPTLSYITAKEAMQINPVTLTPSASIGDALSIMEETKTRGLLVCVNKKVVGIVTKSDLYNVKPSRYDIVTISHMMTRNVISGFQEDTLADIMKKMTVNNIGRMPIISRENQELVGIITWNEIYSAHQKFGLPLLKEQDR